MDEDRLTPQLGRLIDAAKAAARQASEETDAEGVALLTGDGEVHAGSSGLAGAVEVARDRARLSGRDDIVAAAVAAPAGPADTVLPTAESYRSLVLIDPDLPLVFKQRGRWVMMPLSRSGARG